MPTTLATAVVLFFVLVVCGTASPSPEDRPLSPQAATQPSGDMAFVDLSGQARKVSDLRGQVVLLDFWATWCVPCKRSLPLYDEWQKELGPSGLRIVAASVDGTQREVAEFAADLAPSLTVWRDVDGRVASALDLPTMPTAYLISRDGRQLWRHVGFEASEAPALLARIKEALGEE